MSIFPDRLPYDVNGISKYSFAKHITSIANDLNIELNLEELSTEIDPEIVNGFRHGTRWLDSEFAKNLGIVLDDPLFNYPRRVSTQHEIMRTLADKGDTEAIAGLQELEASEPQIRRLIIQSAVRMFDLARPLLAYERTHKRLTRLAKLGPVGALEKGKDYPPHMNLPNYGLKRPELPEGAFFPEHTGISNALIDQFIRLTANDAVWFMESRKRIERKMHNCRRRAEYQLRKRKFSKLPSSKKPTMSSISHISTHKVITNNIPNVHMISKHANDNGIVTKAPLIRRPSPASGQRLSRPRLDKAGIPPKWRNLTDLEKYRVISQAIHRQTSGISITADIDESWMASRRAAGKDVMSEVQQRLAKSLQRGIGSGIAFAAVVEADEDTKPHLHGLVNLRPTPENQRLVRAALLNFTGEYGQDGRTRARRVNVKAFDGSSLWVNYPFKRHALARDTLGVHRVLVTSRPAVRLGKALQDRLRANVLKTAA
ncbi:MAG: hypothetical protein ACQRW7_07770 [Caulobacterales bacterium]|uniref:hypothetical protein n=1 Tax=Glycocaulis sp. TaxID=1969725 RepID=UPI003F9F74D3